MSGISAERWRLAVGLMLFSVAMARPASADDVPTADALFREGRRLLKEHDYEHACPKFADSFRIDPSAGTLLNLARCHEEQGLTATAWGEYFAADRLARKQGRTNVSDAARARAADVEKQLIYVTIRVRVPLPGLRIRRDDVPLDLSAVGAPLPVDPGRHALTVEAAGYETWSTTFEPTREGVTIDVPELAREQPEAPAPAPAPVSPVAPPVEPLVPAPPSAPAVTTEASGASRTRGYVAGGVGLVGLAAGSVFGVLALSDYGDAQKQCPQHQGCSGTALDASNRATTSAWVSDAAFGVGALGLALGAYYLFFGSSTPVKVGARTLTFSF
jgi:hypothetical protein